jgi:serine/threonine protein phosphatase PrpC
MIITSPDVVVEQLKPNKYEFMVLIFDSFWNFISNEELISFMVKTIKTTDKLLKLCEQLFTRVLPPVMPTKEIVGKDNMIFMIVKFERNNQKKIGSNESIFQSFKSPYS